MGENEYKLDNVFREIYSPNKTIYAFGNYKTESGSGILNKFLALFIKVPKTKFEQPLKLNITRKNRTENWSRNFNGVEFNTTFRKLNDNYYHEKYGYFDFYFYVVFDKNVKYTSEKIFFLNIPLNKFIKIKSNNYQLNNYEWYFEVVINTINDNLVFKYYGQMKLAKTN